MQTCMDPKLCIIIDRNCADSPWKQDGERGCVLKHRHLHVGSGLAKRVMRWRKCLDYISITQGFLVLFCQFNLTSCYFNYFDEFHCQLKSKKCSWRLDAISYNVALLTWAFFLVTESVWSPPTPCYPRRWISCAQRQHECLRLKMIWTVDCTLATWFWRLAQLPETCFSWSCRLLFT